MRPSVLPIVRPVWSGYIVRRGTSIVDASSSVTYVEAEGESLLVDTGSPRDEEKLLATLDRMRIQPPSIRYVVNTHMHIDHCGCNDLFKSARVVAHESESPPPSSLRIRSAQGLLPGVEIVPTPGHSEGSISVFVESDKRYAICGDAIPTKDNFEKWVPPFINMDRGLALNSMEMIRSWADVIVPGHDSPIVVGRKK